MQLTFPNMAKYLRVAANNIMSNIENMCVKVKKKLIIMLNYIHVLPVFIHPPPSRQWRVYLENWDNHRWS